MATPISATFFGGIVRRLRRDAKLTHEQLAEKAECHPTYISLVERGKRNPSLDMVLRLSRALECPAWKLVRETEQELCS